MNKIESLKLEYYKTISLIKENAYSLKEIDYFVNLSKEYCENLFETKNSPRLFLLDPLFPTEIIKAMGIEYQFIFGGSFVATEINEFNLPKKVDDEIKSILGILGTLNLKENDVVLVPLINDNYRKLSSLLCGLVKTISYEVTKDKKRYNSQIKKVVLKLKKHFKKNLSFKKLNFECKLSKKASEVFVKFEKIYSDGNQLISPLIFLFISNTYYMSDNKLDWSSHLSKLIDTMGLNQNLKLENKNSKILMFGSPIYFPNYKIPIALLEQNIFVTKFVYPFIENIKIYNNFSYRFFTVNRVCNQYYFFFTRLDTIPELIMYLTKKENYKVLLCLITKGQINIDEQFIELKKILLEKKTISIKIETMFNYQDIEQIRTKLEAISEIW